MKYGAACWCAGIFIVACAARAADADWIERSNGYAKILTDIQAHYAPEEAAAVGVEGHDGEVLDLGPRYSQRQEADLAAASVKLEAAQFSESDLRVKQDLDILHRSAEDQRHTLELQRRRLVPFFDLPESVFSGFQKLIHDGVPPARQAQAVLRLRRYVGAEPGYQPITVLARARLSEALEAPGLVAPWRVELQQSLDNEKLYLQGVRKLFQGSGLKGWQRPLEKFESQVAAYDAWLRTALLPRARARHELPEEIYADHLKQFGVDADPRVLIASALAAYSEIRDELAALAPLVARSNGWPDTDYRSVLRNLKRKKIATGDLLVIYRERLAKIESDVREHRLVTLPARQAVIRLGTDAESAAIPAPHVDVPRLIGNSGEPAAFVIPVSNPNSASGAELDDFSFDAVTWTLTAHEARPGHELQFARMLEAGVSTARALFAFNSTNVEGWALYAEAFMKPYFPLDGQLVVLQLRLMRAARAFLDPMLNLGMIEPEAAKNVLMGEVCLSEPMAKQEIDRYTFKAPGQATSYFYGYGKLEALRAETEIALGDRFDLQSYHDFIVDQGLLPLGLLRTAVLNQYVKERRMAH